MCCHKWVESRGHRRREDPIFVRVVLGKEGRDASVDVAPQGTLSLLVHEELTQPAGALREFFITLIGLIMAEENDADAETGTWANNEKHKLVTAGLATSSIVGFDSFRLSFESFNDMCHTGRHDPEAV